MTAEAATPAPVVALTWITPEDGRNPFQVIDLLDRAAWRVAHRGPRQVTLRTRDDLYAILAIELRGGWHYQVFASYERRNPGQAMQLIGTATDPAEARGAAAFHHESCATSGWWINPMLWPTAQAIGMPV